MVLAMGINFGYIRVSTNEQNLDRQLEAMKNIYTVIRLVGRTWNVKAFRICISL
jgi:hypothetical protein